MNKAKVIGGLGEKKSNRGTQWYQQDRVYDNEVSISVTTDFNPFYKVGGKHMNNLKIRKLTPRECFRLMGVKDEDFDRVAKNQSDSSLYHLAGDSLITTIMMALIGELLDQNWVDSFNSKEWWSND